MARNANVMAQWRGWVPVGIDWSGTEPVVLWFNLGDYRFDDAYFSETMTRCARHPFNLVFGRRTGLDAIEEAASALPPAALSGMIFHMSRCGSTLVSRSLAAVPQTLVISEAPIVDALVRIRRRDPSVTQERQIRLLRSVLALFASAAGPHRYYVLKLDAWHTLDLAAIERAFANVPWIYLYRDPLEVLVSHMARMSYMMSFANAPDFLGITVADAARIPREEYCARVLERITAAIAQREVTPGTLVCYDRLPDAIWEAIAPRFGMSLTRLEVDALRRGASYDAKRPGELFRDDRFLKRQAASPQMHAAAVLVAPHIERLEGMQGRPRSSR